VAVPEIPETRYAKSGDTHIAYQVFGSGSLGLATILFTDIVGSTERALSLGDRRWREPLEQY
jgi:class 3 adenylate cyclase